MSYSLSIKYIDNEVFIDIYNQEGKMGNFMGDFSLVSVDKVKSFISDLDEGKNSILELNDTNGHCSIRFNKKVLSFGVCDSGNVYCSLSFEIPYNETMGDEFRKLVKEMSLN